MVLKGASPRGLAVAIGLVCSLLTHSHRRPDIGAVVGGCDGMLAFLFFATGCISWGMEEAKLWQNGFPNTTLPQAQGWGRCNSENYSSARSSRVSFLEEGLVQHRTHRAGKSGKLHLRSLEVTCGHAPWLPPDEGSHSQGNSQAPFQRRNLQSSSQRHPSHSWEYRTSLWLYAFVCVRPRVEAGPWQRIPGSTLKLYTSGYVHGTGR